jgi:hypothetical protein
VKVAARKQKPKTTSEAPQVVEGVTLAKVDIAVFNAAYLQALEAPRDKKTSKLTLPPDGSPLHERVKAFVLWNRATTAVDKLSDCSSCGGDSSIELDMCPFCGDHEVVDAEGNLVAGNSAGTEDPSEETSGIVGREVMQVEPDPQPDAPAAALPSSPQDELAAVQPPTPKRTKKPRQGAAQAPASDPPAAPPAPVAGPAVPTAADPLPPTRSRKLRSAGRAGIVAEHDALDASLQSAMDRDRDPPEPTAIVVAPSTEIVEAPVAGFTVGDLNKSVKLITELKRTAADSLWKLGQAVKSVLDNRLWMLRTDAQGAPKYRTFKQFVVGELDMSYMQAHRLAQVSEGFTEEEMTQIGVSKCHVMLQVPKDRRAGLLASAEQGATLTQISNEVAKMTANERPKPPSRTGQALTVAMVQGRVELPLFARPKGRHGYASEAEQKANPRPAMGITDDPFCVELLPNDVLVTYNIAKNLDGSWVLIVHRRRAKDEELFQDEGADDEEEES